MRLTKNMRLTGSVCLIKHTYARKAGLAQWHERRSRRCKVYVYDGRNCTKSIFSIALSSPMTDGLTFSIADCLALIRRFVGRMRLINGG